MIPQTFPSVLDSSNRTQMVIYMLPSITGLTKWIDYIPVKSSPGEGDLTLINRYEANGYIYTTTLSDITGKQAWKDYIPVYIDSSANTAWSSDNDGYIPMSGLAVLLLDFTTGRLDSKINFSRTSNATVTNSAGLITYAPHNLLTYSEQFDNAAWTKTNATVAANTTTAPDGTLTADKLIENAGAGSKTIRNIIATTAGIIYTYSFYAKAGERNWVIAGQDNSGTGYFWVNLANGTFGNTSGTYVSRAITPAANGFYRISITYSAASTSASGICFLDSTNGGISYTGDGTSGIYLWGAQLEVGASPTTYNSTTVKNLLGYSELFDNAAWTKSNSFVQTNLLKYSEDFSVSASWNASSGVTSNTTIAPNGYQTADTIDASLGTAYQPVACTASTVYTYSIYIQLGTLSAANFKFAVRDDTAGVFIAQDIVPTQIPTSSGWTRITYTFTTPVGCLTVRPYVMRNTAAPSGTFYAWGAQLVQGSTAGDYRRTDAVALPIYYANHNGVVCAEQIHASAGNGTVLESFTATGGSMTMSVWLRRITGTGNVDLTLDSGSTYTTQTITSSWARYSVTGSPAAGAKTAGIRLVTSGDVVQVFGAMVSDSASLDLYVLNAAASPTAAAYYGARFDYDASGVTSTTNYSSELVTNGDFSGGSTGWTTSTGWAIAAGKATATALAGALPLSNTFNFANNKTYIITYTVSDYVAGGVSWANLGTGQAGIARTANGTYREVIVANGTGAISFIRRTSDFTGSIDNVSVIEYIDYTITGTTQLKGLLIEEQRSNLLLNSTINGAPLSSQSVIVTATAYTLSFYGTGSIVLSGTASATLTGTGAYPTRSTLTFTPTAGTLILTATGNVQFAQLEAGSFATSYIPTGASQVTRTADVATIQGSNFYSWINQNEGTYYAEGSALWTNSATNRYIAALLGATGFIWYSDSTGSNVQSFDGTNILTLANTNWNTNKRYTSSYKASTKKISVAGVITSGSYNNGYGVATGITLRGFDGGYIKNFRYYSTDLSNAVQQGLTA